ncbi:hypothetical protein GGI04_002298 [Coemansia thaxteri]|nr:hypothetical protein GGI04_002298 [Coemansia thaxteri]
MGTDNELVIGKLIMSIDIVETTGKAGYQSENQFVASEGSEHSAIVDVDSVPAEAPLFNIDSLLDLMSGDDNGDVDFNAIIAEIGSNLANVIDMNEVGNMAATMAIMMTGMNAVAELQRHGINEMGNEGGSVDTNNAINSGIAALVGQLLAEQNLPGLLDMAGSTGPNKPQPRESKGRGGGGPPLDGLGIAQILNDIASNGAADVNMLGINQLVGNIANSYAQTGSPSRPEDASNLSNIINGLASGAPAGGSIADTIGNVVSSGGARNIAAALTDFMNGNDSANFSGIAQAIGIRNFLKTDDKKTPDGCPSCFNCLYPGSAHARKFTDIINVVEHVVCLADDVCNSLNPTGEGGPATCLTE